MKVFRFAVVGLSVFGVGACLYAIGRVAGVFPTSKLPPYPSWTVIHFVTAGAFAALLPLQLWPAIRRRHPGVHRMVGRIAVGIGTAMAGSGVAMVHLVPDRTISERIFMTVIFAAYMAMLGLGLRAALARDFATHRAWMARMTATTLTPLTQRLVFPLFAAGLGIDGLATFWQIFVSAAWLAWGINMTAAEVWLRRQDVRVPRAAALA